MIGMMTLLTSEVIILPNAAPIITPTARSMTLPFNANALNSSISDNAFLLAPDVERLLNGSMNFLVRIELAWIRLDQPLDHPAGAERIGPIQMVDDGLVRVDAEAVEHGRVDIHRVDRVRG